MTLIDKLKPTLLQANHRTPDEQDAKRTESGVRSELKQQKSKQLATGS
jgi:hypothetical protein